MSKPTAALILWSYDASPFTQKALGALAIKRVPFRWVETPMMPPKDDLITLTGGYRGTPVLQVGSEVFIDSQLIACELERLFPSPSLFQLGGGVELALVRWSDAFFRSALKIVLAVGLVHWPEPFRTDRQYLFPDIDFDTVGDDAEHSRSQFRAHAALLEAQLADGRDYLAGGSPSLIDVQAYPFLWMARGSLGDLATALLSNLPRLAAWELRMRSVWHYERHPCSAAEALSEARAASITTRIAIDPADAQGLRAGDRVEVMPDDTRRGAVLGRVHLVTADRITIARDEAAAGGKLIHFPRLGYRVKAIA